MNIEQLLARRKDVLEQHRQAMTVVEQTRGALMMLDELISGLQAGTDGAAEVVNDVEATGGPERIIPS